MKRLSILLCTFLFIASCEESLNVKIPVENSKLSVTSYLHADDYFDGADDDDYADVDDDDVVEDDVVTPLMMLIMLIVMMMGYPLGDTVRGKARQAV